MASKQCLTICGAVSCCHSLLFFIFAIWCISEMGRFNPFYTKVQCTNPLLTLDLNKYLDANGNVDVKDFAVNMECSNPNQFQMSIGTKSTGDVMLYAGGLSVKVGAVKTPKATDFKIDCKKTPWYTSMNMFLPAAVFGGLVADITAQVAVAVPIPSVPLFFSLNADTTLSSRFMFMPNELKMVLPKKYCGAQCTALPSTAQLATSPWAKGALQSVGRTICRDSLAEAITAVTATTLSKTNGPKTAIDHSSGYIDHLDPEKKFLDDNEGKAKQGAMMFLFIFVVTMISCLVGSICCIKKSMAPPPPAPEAKAEEKAPEAAAPVVEDPTTVEASV